MDKILFLICALFALAMIFIDPPGGAISVLVVLLSCVVVISLIRYYSEEKIFLTRIFLIALLARLTLGIIIHIFDLRNIFGPDSLTYDAVGQRIVEIWSGLSVSNDYFTYRALNGGDSGWGMYYFVALIYFITGQSILAAQSFCAVVGAATVPMVYFCAEKIFLSKRVARVAAIAIALFPSFIVWSSQLIKDGLLIFLLVLAMTMVLELQKKFGYAAIAGLIFALFGIIALRFYIFYMVAVSIAGSFFIGLETSVKVIIRNSIAVVIVGLALTYLGVLGNTTANLDRYANLERIQASREYLATSAKTGYGEDLDVSTTGGAIAAIPISFSYLMFAPFPWQIDNFKMLLLLPEMLIWWASIPILIGGAWYTLNHRLRRALPILLFSLMLTIAYSLLQGNLGMAYRQRTQIQVFLFIFIAVGWTILREHRENQEILREIARSKYKRQLKGQSSYQNLQQEKI